MKYLLMMHYGPADTDQPMCTWPPEDVKAHLEFQRRFGQELADNGELVDGQGLAGPELARIVTSDGQSAPVVTDGPFPESKEFLAGYWVVDVETGQRAVEIAAMASAAPGPGGVPLRLPIEVREVLSAPSFEE